MLVCVVLVVIVMVVLLFGCNLLYSEGVIVGVGIVGVVIVFKVINNVVVVIGIGFGVVVGVWVGV